jgi:flagellar motility protein MotE (MotC chaperone)
MLNQMKDIEIKSLSNSGIERVNTEKKQEIEKNIDELYNDYKELEKKKKRLKEKQEKEQGITF